MLIKATLLAISTTLSVAELRMTGHGDWNLDLVLLQVKSVWQQHTN